MHAVTDDPAVVAILHEPGRVRARDVKADNVHVIAEVAKNKDRGQLRLAGASDPRAPPHIGDVGDARARGAAGARITYISDVRWGARIKNTPLPRSGQNLPAGARSEEHTSELQ